MHAGWKPLMHIKGPQPGIGDKRWNMTITGRKCWSKLYLQNVRIGPCEPKQATKRSIGFNKNQRQDANIFIRHLFCQERSFCVNSPPTWTILFDVPILVLGLALAICFTQIAYWLVGSCLPGTMQPKDQMVEWPVPSQLRECKWTMTPCQVPARSGVIQGQSIFIYSWKATPKHRVDAPCYPPKYGV